jgi:hypothetical protein
MRTLVIRITALVLVAVLALAVAVVALGDQPKVLQTYSGPVPDVQCPIGVSPAQTFCYATAVPIPGAPQPSPFDIGVPTTVGGVPITTVSVSDNEPMSGVPADDILRALDTTRSQAAVWMGTWSHGDVWTLYVPTVPGPTLLATTVANWDGGAVTARSSATVGGRSVAVLTRRDGVKAYVFAYGPVVYVVETAGDADASELIASIP